ncbi:RNA polymerase sigma factor [Streptomyces boninensis]|uniref:RNA polymerase sigma factor n=1 Tax=Streptomyces boninensis TaxID=2039455 RepID=UPI003B219B42
MPPLGRDFERFFRRDFPLLAQHLKVLGYERQLAEDAAQEAMIMALQHWGDITEPRAWVRVAGKRIAQRLYENGQAERDRLHRAAISQRPLAGHAPDPHHYVQHQAEQDAVADALRLLPLRQREVMAWHLDGFTTAEISGYTDCAGATVRSNFRHAREQLKRILGMGDEEGGDK